MAWFHSAPTDKTKKATTEKPLTRAQRIEQNGGTPLLPDVYEATYLVSYWQELGMAMSGGMGAVSITSQEIAAWSAATGIELNAWEFSMIREMSRAYVGQLHESESLECPPPFGAALNEIDRETVGKKITNAFRAFILAKKK